MDQFDFDFAKFIVKMFKEGKKKGEYEDGGYMIFGSDKINQVVYMRREGRTIKRKVYENGNKKEFINGNLTLEVEGNVKKEYDNDLGLVKMIIKDNDETMIVEAKQYLTKLVLIQDDMYKYYILFDRKGKVDIDLSSLIPPEFDDKLENISLYYAEYDHLLAFKDNRYTMIIFHDNYDAIKLIMWDQEEIIKEIKFSNRGETTIEFSRDIIPFELELNIQSSLNFGEPIDYQYNKNDLVWILE